MQIRDRIKELRRVQASELLPNPKNWRTHPSTQADALSGILAEVRWADAVLARETDQGLQLIDRHHRAEVGAAHIIPVLVVDLNDDEANLVLANHEPQALSRQGRERAEGKVAKDRSKVTAIIR